MPKDNDEITIVKKSWIRKLIARKLFWFVVVLVIVIILVVVGILNKDTDAVEFVTEDVTLGNITQTVNATGSVESAHDIELNFKTAGRLVYLTVDEGSVVVAGQVLARIDSASLMSQVSQYQANLDSARADLAQTLAGSSNEAIDVSKEKLDKSQRDLDSLMVKRDDEIKTLQIKALNAVNNANFTAIVALDKVYNHLINSVTTLNLRFSDSVLTNVVASRYSAIKSGLDSLNSDIDVANVERDSESILAVADDLGESLLDLNEFLNISYDLADKIVVNDSYPQATKDTIKSDVSTQQATNNTSLTSVQTAKSNLVNSVNSYRSQVQAAEDALAIFRAELNLKNAGPRDFEVQSAEAKVSQAQAQLNKTLNDLSDYSISAPISGIVTKVNYSIGEQTSLASSVVKILGTGEFEIKVDIPESDIAKINVSDIASVELDAFGSDHLFAGVVTFIDPAQTTISDVVYYQTTVSFDEDDLLSRVKTGMSADVTLVTGKKEGVLYIPQRAVKIKESMLGETPEKFVEILNADETIAEMVVEIGLRADGGMIEIVAGLNEGDRVIVFKKNGK
jgi:HlyD family secretion protein